MQNLPKRKLNKNVHDLFVDNYKNVLIEKETPNK